MEWAFQDDGITQYGIKIKKSQVIITNRDSNLFFLFLCTRSNFVHIISLQFLNGMM